MEISETLDQQKLFPAMNDSRLRVPFSSRTVHWGWMVALLVGIFLIRGVWISCVIPPFEMCDEYQHVAYIQFLLDHGHPPVFLKDNVSVDLVRQVVAFPMGDAELQQLNDAGGTFYREYWNAPDRLRFKKTFTSINLYESQHPPVYYRLMAPIYRLAGGLKNPRRSVSILRLFNVVFEAAGLLAVLIWLGKACRSKAFAAAIGLVVVMHPFTLLDSLRVANDALAVGIGCIAVVWAMSIDRRWVPLHALLIGLMIGLGVMVKPTDLAITPFVGFCLLLLTVRRRISIPNCVISGALLAAGLLVPTCNYFYHNLTELHQLTAVNEVVLNRQQHKTLHDYIVRLPLPVQDDEQARITRENRFEMAFDRLVMWKIVILQWFLDNDLWIGGWSVLFPPPIFDNCYVWLVEIGLAGWVLAWLYRLQSAAVGDVFRQPWVAPRLLAMVACITLGMCYHALASMVQYGVPTTQSSYAVVAMPFFLTVVASFSLAWRHTLLGRAGYIPALLLPLVFFFTEFYGTTQVMLPRYSWSLDWRTELHRAAFLHPPYLRTATFYIAGGSAVLLFAWAWLCVAWQLLKNPGGSNAGLIAKPAVAIENLPLPA